MKSALIVLVLSVSNFATSQTPTSGEYTIFYYANGSKSAEGFLFEGMPLGIWKNYYEDGSLKSIGKRTPEGPDSTWTFYRNGGTLDCIVDYKGGKKEGKERVYGRDGVLTEETEYRSDLREGIAHYHYDTGEIYRTLNYKGGKEEGAGKEFDKDGRLITRLVFTDGFLLSIEKVNRFNPDGLRTGVWIEMHDNGKVRSEGNYSEGKKNGIFKVFSRKGEFERFELYSSDQLLPENDLSFIPDIRKELYETGELKLVGVYREGSKQGVFREYARDGTILSTTIYEENVKTGEGIMDEKGRRQGDWIIYHPSGEVRAGGAYKDGKRTGVWTYYYKSGETEQTGNYLNDLPDGQWIWRYANGNIWREESFTRGKEDGPLKEYDEQGGVLVSGEYSEGLKTGEWIVSIGDHVERGVYADGEKDKIWQWHNSEGRQLFIGEFNNGTPVGRHRYFHHNGTLALEGKHKSGERHGVWRTYNEDGSLYFSTDYKEGQTVKIDGMKTEQTP